MRESEGTMSFGKRIFLKNSQELMRLGVAKTFFGFEFGGFRGFAFFQVYTIGIKPRLANKAVLAAHFFFMILFKVIGYSGHISSGMVFCENLPRNADSGDHVFNFAKDFGPGCRVCK